jgi:polar amino acid transport system substrate-binding protein
MTTRQSSKWTVRAGVAALSALTLLLSACGAGNAPSTSTGSGAQGTSTIGHAGTLVPGEFKWGADSTGGMPYIVPADSLNPASPFYGFEVDIAIGMAKAMGIEEIPTQITWSNWPQGLASQQFDFFMNGLEITSDNVKQAKFSIPYYVYTQSIVVLSSNSTINSFDDLAGKTVETGTGYKAETIIDSYNASHSNKIKKVTTDNPTPFTDLLSHRVDAEFLDTPIAKWYGSSDPSGAFKIVGGDEFPGYYGIGFSPTNPNTPILLPEINKAIEQLWNDGTLKNIYQNGFAYNQAPNGPVVKEKYDLWNDSEACIGNFLPDHPTNVPNCPQLVES